MVSPDLTTASADTERGPTPPRISPLRAAPRPATARHVLTPPQGALLASRVPSFASRPLRVKPVPSAMAPQVASRPAPQALPDVPGPSVRVLTPAVTPDETRTAVYTPSLNGTLRGVAVALQHKATLTGRTFTANSRTVAANFTLATADSSGTANITEGPVR